MIGVMFNIMKSTIAIFRIDRPMSVASNGISVYSAPHPPLAQSHIHLLPAPRRAGVPPAPGGRAGCPLSSGGGGARSAPPPFRAHLGELEEPLTDAPERVEVRDRLTLRRERLMDLLLAS